MKHLLLIVLTAITAIAQVRNSEKAAWIARDGKFLDNIYTNTSLGFAVLEGGTYNSADSIIANRMMADYLYNDALTWSSAKAGGPLTVIIHRLYGNDVASNFKNALASRINILKVDDYLWNDGWGNGGINTHAAHYLACVTATTADSTSTVRYDDINNSDPAPNFTYAGRSYVVGNTYSAYKLCRDYLLKWMERYVEGQSIKQEMFSPTYSIHFTNVLATLADSRMTFDTVMRTHASMTLQLWLAENGMNGNNTTWLAPYGRHNRPTRVNGPYDFFPSDAYFGVRRPTHYGHFGTNFFIGPDVESVIEDAVRLNDEDNSYITIQKSQVDGAGLRYGYVGKNVALGSHLNGGNWGLAIGGGTGGNYPQSRPGCPNELWLNDNPDDMVLEGCFVDCPSDGGMGGHQYRDAILIIGSNLILHEAITNGWDTVEPAGNWIFATKNGIGVALTYNASWQSAALEICILGETEPDMATFKNSVQTVGSLSSTSYRTRKGTVISVVNGNTLVDGVEVNPANSPSTWPRMDIRKLETNGSLTPIFTSVYGTKIFSITRNGATFGWNFNNWTTSSSGGGPDMTPPPKVTGFRAQQN